MGRLARGGAKKTMIALTIKDKVVLHNYYMPFIKNGGLFIANRTEYDVGDDVFILLNLMGESEKIPVAGKVAWIAKKTVLRAPTCLEWVFSLAIRTISPRIRLRLT